MRVLLSTYGSRGDVEPMLGLAVQLRALGAQVRVCAPPNFAERVAEVGVELVPAGHSARTLAVSAVREAAAGCDVYATFQQLMLPSQHQPPLMYPGRPFPPERTDAKSINAMFGEMLNTYRASIGVAPVVAADLEAFLDACTPPVYVGFGSMPMGESTDVASMAIEAIRAQGRRAVARGWAGLAVADGDDCIGVGEVNQQALFGRVAAVVHHGRRSAVLGGPGGRAGHRRGTRRADAYGRIRLGCTSDGADSGDPCTSERRGRHHPRRRGEGRRETCT